MTLPNDKIRIENVQEYMFASVMNHSHSLISACVWVCVHAIT